MKPRNYIIQSFLSSFGVLLYVSSLMWVIFHSEQLFGAKAQEPNFLIPVMMLLLFIVSACITGGLVLGRPLHLYLSGLKKEAFTLLFSTIGWLVLFLALVAGTLLSGVRF